MDPICNWNNWKGINFLLTVTGIVTKIIQESFKEHLESLMDLSSLMTTRLDYRQAWC